jgi:hypothetical protein
MFKFNKLLELPPQLAWKYAQEPELLGWTIRARNYSTFIANTGFALISSVGLAASITMYLTDERTDEPWRTLWAVILFLGPTLLFWGGLGQRVNIAYRFTQTGWEYCKWKDTPNWHLAAVKWVTGLMAVVSLYLISIDPFFIIGALLGPGGMALTYLSMANSETYQTLQTEYNHVTFEWREINAIAIATNREIVDLKYQRIGKGNSAIENVNIYCRRKQKETVAKFVERCLPASTSITSRKLTNDDLY